MFLTAGVWAESTLPYVENKEGQRPKAIVAVDNVCAWPNLNVLGDGAIVATIFNQPSHGSLPGDVECWATIDGGPTWHKRGTPAAHEPDTNRMNVAAGLAKNGDLLVISSGWSNRYPADRKGPPLREGILDPWVCRSADGGRTWTVDRHAFPAKGPRGGPCIPFGNIFPGRDHALRVAIYEAPNLRDDRVYIYRSPDDGKTWGEPAALDEGHKRNETALLHLGGGKWLAAARVSELQLYASDDDAKTWHPCGPVTKPAQHPGHLLRLRDGRLLLSYGNRTADRGVDVRFSRDEGKTWGEPLRVADFQEDGGYPSSVELPDSQVLTAFYARKTAYHDRYHMGVVVWDPTRTMPQVHGPFTRLPAIRLQQAGKLPTGIDPAGKLVLANEPDGGNASKFQGAWPYQPCFGELVAWELERRYGSKVTFLNHSRGGATSAYGVSQAESQVGWYRPDIAIIAFGMNDRAPDRRQAYRANLEKIIDTVREQSPEAEIILVTAMLNNPKQPGGLEPILFLRDEALRISRPGLAFVDMTTTHLEMLRRKDYLDLSGNGVNHPNDFLHRIYAQRILEVLVPREAP